MILNNLREIRKINTSVGGYSSDSYKGYMKNVITTSNEQFGDAWPDAAHNYYGHPAPYTYLRSTSTQLSQTERPYLSSTSAFGHADIVIGSSSVAPSASDYALLSEITGFSVLTGTLKLLTNGVSIVRTYKNSLDTTITINEVGVRTLLGIPSGTSSKYFYSILLTREVLSTPLVVPSGEIFTVSVTVPY